MSFTLWFTGISGAGKTTLSQLAAQALRDRGLTVELLDGDRVRSSLGNILTFDERDRRVNIRMLGLLSLLLNEHGIVSIVAAISPLEEERARNRALLSNYVEVYCETTFACASRRDVKGLYKKALQGGIENFTSISSAYEPPSAPSLVLRTHQETVQESFGRLMAHLEASGHMPSPAARPDAVGPGAVQATDADESRT